jgi:hypothetical protein
MVAVNEITTYKEDNMFWADATEVVDVSAACAWKSLDSLLMRIIRIPTTRGDSVKLVRVKEDVPVTHVGNKFVAKAAMLDGLIKASMSMKITDAAPPRYLRLAIRTFNMHFADVDFRIEPIESSCRMTYRQGFRSKNNSSKRVGEQVNMKSREMPETARIFNLWVEIARETHGGQVE